MGTAVSAARLRVLGVLAAVVLGAGAAGCATTVAGTATAVTGLDTSPPSTGATSSSRTVPTVPTVPSRTTTTAPPTTTSSGGGATTLACTILLTADRKSTGDYNDYIQAVNADSPEADAKKAVAVTSIQATASTMSTFPVDDPAVSGPARALGTALSTLAGLLPTATDSDTLNAAADDADAKSAVLRTACGS